jgi:hypothetical protein
MINRKIAVCLGACFVMSSVVFAQHVPARIGVIPGISSQGKNDNTTTSNFSLNVFGGSTGSVNGLEMGSLFNINKMNMQGVQAAGLFNLTGGNVNGLQMASLFNTVKGNFTGAQYGGLINYVNKDMRGLQVASLYNQITGKLTGAQYAGLANFTQQPVKGLQIAGIANINSSSVTGAQIAGIVNYTKHLKGFQLGLINIADTSSGYSIGLLNIVRKGYHKIALSSNEVLNLNVAIKSGNAKLYNILMVGINAGNNDKTFSYGYGIGHEMKIAKWFTLNPELTTQYLYLGNWNYLNQLSKLHVLANFKLSKGIALFAGPSFSVYYSDQPEAIKGYKYLVPKDSYNTFELWHSNVTGWIGWSAGISFL